MERPRHLPLLDSFLLTGRIGPIQSGEPSDASQNHSDPNPGLDGHDPNNMDLEAKQHNLPLSQARSARYLTLGIWKPT